jgi:hypothetical protein
VNIDETADKNSTKKTHPLTIVSVPAKPKETQQERVTS